MAYKKGPYRKRYISKTMKGRIARLEKQMAERKPEAMRLVLTDSGAAQVGAASNLVSFITRIARGDDPGQRTGNKVRVWTI